jgi:hypothetical protein
VTTLFAPTELLSAYSYAVDGADQQEPLTRGTHVRIFGGLGGAFPLAPFAVFGFASNGNEPYGVHYTDVHGSPVGAPDLSQFGTLLGTPFFGDTEQRRTVRVDLFPYPHGSLRSARLLDPQGRVITEQRTEPFAFSAPAFSRFLLHGHSTSLGVQSRSVDAAQIAWPRVPLRTLDVLGLPVTGRQSWYVGMHDRQQALARVDFGAPRFLNAMDRPDGPFDAVDGNAEVARVEAMLGSARFGGGLEALVEAMVTDAGTPPWAQAPKEPLPDGRQFATVPRLGSVQLAAIDPGLARFLGFASRIDDFPDLGGGGGWDTLVVVALLAVDPTIATKLPLLAQWVAQPDPNEPLLVQLLARGIKDATGVDVMPELGDVAADARARGLLTRAVLAVTAPLPPWLPPEPSSPGIVENRWQTSDGTNPSNAYRATFAFDDAPLAALAAVASEIDGGWETRHDLVDIAGGSPPSRAKPRLFGHERAPSARIRTQLRAGASAPLRAGALLSDENLPAERGTLTYRFRASDFFGRFGDPVETQIDPPPRPAPPKPVVRYALELHDEGLDALPAAGSLSPGTLQLTFAAPPYDGSDARARTAIAVPSLGELAAGSLPIVKATVLLDGAPKGDVDFPAGGFFSLALPLPQLAPQTSGDVTLTVFFTDAGQTDSEQASTTFTVTDKRLPKTVATGIGLFWTSAPGPAPDVQLQLAWQGPPNLHYRVYATDQHGLGLTDHDLAVPGIDAPPSRGRVAEVGTEKVRSGAHIPRDVFRLLANVTGDASGQALLQTTLPRSLESVQFLRIVPLTTEGAEAPFDSCGVVPVAVPESRRPPLPRLDGSVDPATGHAHLDVSAPSFDRSILRRDEPGLFDPAVADVVPPSFRIRRTVGMVDDPVYGRQIADGTLAHEAAAEPSLVFRGEAPDTNGGRGLEPYVRYVYWADVRLPPERRLPVGSPPDNGGFSTPDPANSLDYPRPSSLPSAPRTLMHVPAAPPVAPDDGAITATISAATAAGSELTLEIADPPTAHAKAVAQYRLAVWTQWPQGPIERITNADGDQLGGAWPELTPEPLTIVVPPPVSPATPGLLTVRIAYIDPVGRMGAITVTTVS